MPRKARIDAPGALHHIICRGIGRRRIFQDDERILGDSDFVQSVLEAEDEKMERRYRLKAQGYDLDTLIRRVAELRDIEPRELLAPGKQPQLLEI